MSDDLELSVDAHQRDPRPPGRARPSRRQPSASSLQVDVGPKVHQPFGLLHGGVSALLAESAASIGATRAVWPDEVAVGIELNCSHLRAARRRDADRDRDAAAQGPAPARLGRRPHRRGRATDLRGALHAGDHPAARGRGGRGLDFAPGGKGSTMGVRFRGWGTAVPDRVVTNDDLSLTLDTSDAWITERTGIRSAASAGRRGPSARLAGRRARCSTPASGPTRSTSWCWRPRRPTG